MKAYVFEKHGGIDQLQFVDLPMPVIGPDDCLVKVEALSLNGFDPMILEGSTSLKTPLPMIPCGDVAGTVVSVGANVTTVKAGDRVSVIPYMCGGMLGETARGSACEFMSVPAAALIALPDSISFIDAAALPIAYGTAYRMVGPRGQIKAGETVLIHGAAGGVGVACVQLAKAAGAQVVAVASSRAKLDKLAELGADLMIDSSREDFREVCWQHFGKPRFVGAGSSGGVDVVINYVIGNTVNTSLRVLKAGGRMLTCGASAGHMSETDYRYVWSFELSIVGSNGWFPDDQHRLIDMVAEGKLKPALHGIRPLADLPSCLHEMIDRRVFGKSILVNVS